MAVSPARIEEVLAKLELSVRQSETHVQLLQENIPEIELHYAALLSFLDGINDELPVFANSYLKEWSPEKDAILEKFKEHKADSIKELSSVVPSAKELKSLIEAYARESLLFVENTKRESQNSIADETRDFEKKKAEQRAHLNGALDKILSEQKSLEKLQERILQLISYHLQFDAVPNELEEWWTAIREGTTKQKFAEWEARRKGGQLAPAQPTTSLPKQRKPSRLKWLLRQVLPF